MSWLGDSPTADRIIMSCNRDVVVKDATIRTEYNVVYVALLRWQLYVGDLIEQELELRIKRSVEMTAHEYRSYKAAYRLQDGLQKEFAREFEGEHGKTLAAELSAGLAEHLCEKIGLGQTTTQLPSGSQELELQTPFTVKNALIILKTYGDCDIQKLDTSSGEDVKLKVNLGVKVLFLDLRKLKSYNEKDSLKEAIAQKARPWFTPMMMAPNPLVQNMRCRLARHEDGRVMHKSETFQPPAEGDQSCAAA